MTSAFITSIPVILRRGVPLSQRSATTTGTQHFKQHHVTPIRRALICTATPAGPTADAGPEAAAKAVETSNVMIFSTTYCSFSSHVKSLFANMGVEYTVWELDTMTNGDDIRGWLMDSTGQRTVPNVFIRGNHIGGCDDTLALHDNGKLLKLIEG